VFILFQSNPRKVTAVNPPPLCDISTNPDPYAILHNGKYYIYSTGWHGVNVLESDDMKTFVHKGFALQMEGHNGFWAPAVFFYKGLFYMYFSCEPGQFMKVAVSDNPLGPFEYKKTFYNEFSIDAHVVQKEGELWLIYAGKDFTGERGGTVVKIDKLLDPFTPAHYNQTIIKPTIDEEIYARNDLPDGGHHYCIEGGFYFEHEGIGYLMYSANAYTHGDYFVGYCTIDAKESFETAQFKKFPDDHTYAPLIGKDEWVTGCGHNSMITGPAGELLIVYHGRPRSEALAVAGDGRQICVSEIKIIDGKLTLCEWV